jgi:hypothetical protein
VSSGEIKPRKSFVAPVWVLAFTALLRSIISVLTYITIWKYRRGHANISMLSISISVLLITMLIIQAIVYWQIRKKIHKRSWVWLHLFLLIIPMIIVPAMFIIIPLVIAGYAGSGNPGALFRNLNLVSVYFFWTCMIAGNAFFAATLVKSFHIQPGPDNDTGLVDI